MTLSIPRMADLLKAISVAASLLGSYAFVYFSGGAAEFSTGIFLIPVILTTIWAGPLAGACVGLAAGVLAGPLLPLHTSTGQAQGLLSWVPNMLYFAGIGWAIGLFNSRLRRRTVELSETAQRLQERTTEATEAKDRADWASGELAAVNSAALSLVANEGLSVVLQRIADLSRQVGKARYAAVAVNGPEGIVKQFITSGISPEERERIGAIPHGEGLIAAVLKGQSIRTDNLAAHGESVGFPQSHPVMQQFLGVPVAYENRTLAALYLSEPESGKEFTSEDEHSLTLFAAHAAAAIENANLHVAQASRMRDLEVLSQIDAEILGGTAYQELASLMVQGVRELFGARLCILSSLEGDLVVPIAVAGEGLTEADKSRMPALHVGEDAAGWAVLRNEVVAVPDYASDPRMGNLGGLRDELGLESAISAPLSGSDGPIGALCIVYDVRQSFTDDDIERVGRVADRLSLGFQHLRQQERLQGMTIETVTALAESIESRDPYTGGHCARLVEHVELIAVEMGITGGELEILRYGAALHDCGKVGVPDRVLKKPGPLTPDEWAEMRLHPYIGGQLCKRVSFLRQVVPIVYHHHEKYDGSGYPDGLAGEAIPIGARIVAVADAYDSMTSDRPYRDAPGHAYAIRELRKYAGTQFDPSCVDAFERAIAREKTAAAELESFAPEREDRAA